MLCRFSAPCKGRFSCLRLFYSKEVFFLEKICKTVVDSMAFLVIGVAVLGIAYPPALTWVGPYIPWMLGLVMFGMGMTLSVDDFKGVLSHPLEVGIGVFAQFLLMPLIAWGLVKAFGLPPELAIGVVLVGTCPGGTASNVIAYLAKGDVALSVSMTMVTTLLAPLVTPALTYFLAGAWIEISMYAMMVSIAQMVLAPVLLGLLVHHYCGGLVEKVSPLLPVFSVAMIVTLVGGVVALSAGKLLEVGALMAAVVILHNGCGLALGVASCLQQVFLQVTQANMATCVHIRVLQNIFVSSPHLLSTFKYLSSHS